MKSTSGSEREKRNAGESAADLVSDGDVVGLGTGSTTAYAVRRLGERIREEGLEIRGIPTSYQSRQIAIEEGIPLTSLDVETPDIDIDGADQFDDDLSLVKGGGAAHLREKIVASASDRVVIVADESKYSKTLDYPVPVEVVGDAVDVVESRLSDMGGDPELREAERKDGPVVTDNGNLVLDVDFGEFDASSLEPRISEVPGVVEHGVFEGIADEIHIGKEDGVKVKRKQNG
ncbi:ribose 5-phosphate isomerase A [Halorutilales archaeon Cl-col2-1]